MRKILFTYIFPILVFLFPSINIDITSETNDFGSWKLIKDKNGIKVYVNKAPKVFASVHIHARVETTIKKFIDYTHNVEAYTDWIYACIEAKTLHQEGNIIIYSTVTDMPFPFSDRILTLRSSHDIHAQYYEANSYSVPSKNPEGSYVEIPHFEGVWKVRQITPDVISIDYTVKTDPGGHIPPWMFNLAVDVGPFKTMSALKNKLESP